MAKKKPEVRKPEEVERAPAGTFAPGASGNPGGQPKWVKELRDALGEKCAPKAERVANEVLDRAGDMKSLTDVLEDEDADPMARVRAEQAIQARYDQAIRVMAEVWKYTLPKPKQEVEVTGLPQSPLASMTSADILAFLKGSKKE